METPAWARRPAWADRLVALVADEFAATGAAGWADPHLTGDPAELQYSVCSDPGRYRILDVRIEAWGRVLDRLGLATVTVLPPPDASWEGGFRSPEQLQRVTVLSPTVVDGLTLSFATTLVDGAPFGVDVGVGSRDLPTVLLSTVPGCGCDACDDGSGPELDSIDAAVLTAARGGVVHARSGRRTATSGIECWHASDGGPESWLAAAQPVPASVRRWLGEPWLAE